MMPLFSRSKIRFALLWVVLICPGSAAWGDPIFDDFDDNNFSTNTSGTGTGFVYGTQHPATSLTESGSEATITALTWNLGSAYSDQVFNLMGPNVTVVFDMGIHTGSPRTRIGVVDQSVLAANITGSGFQNGLPGAGIFLSFNGGEPSGDISALDQTGIITLSLNSSSYTVTDGTSTVGPTPHSLGSITDLAAAFSMQGIGTNASQSFDSISVSAVPEPSAVLIWLMLGSIVSCKFAFFWRTKNK